VTQRLSRTVRNARRISRTRPPTDPIKRAEYMGYRDGKAGKHQIPGTTFVGSALWDAWLRGWARARMESLWHPITREDGWCWQTARRDERLQELDRILGHRRWLGPDVPPWRRCA